MMSPRKGQTLNYLKQFQIIQLPVTFKPLVEYMYVNYI